MRKFRFIPALLLCGLAACNSGSDQSSANTDTARAAGADTAKMTHDSMSHMVDSSKLGTPLPEVPAGAKVFFKNLKDGSTVKSPVKIEMGVEGMKLDTAGAIVSGSGHHHLLVDAGDSIPAGLAVPKDSTHLHFGKAQSVADVALTPGKHTLTLQFADGIHRSYGARLAKTITVVVK